MSSSLRSDPPLSVFSIGCLIGMMVSYANLTGFLAGLVAGIFVQTNGPHIGGAIMQCASLVTDGSMALIRRLHPHKSSDDDHASDARRRKGVGESLSTASDAPTAIESCEPPG